jgi:hypothetical protein
LRRIEYQDGVQVTQGPGLCSLEHDRKELFERREQSLYRVFGTRRDYPDTSPLFNPGGLFELYGRLGRRHRFWTASHRGLRTGS